MVSPKLVPLNSLHSCHCKVPVLSLWERVQFFKSKDLGAAEVHGTRGSCLIGPTDSFKVWSFSAFKIHSSLFFLGSELLSDLQQRHGRT